MPGCKVPEILRIEAYVATWAFCQPVTERLYILRGQEVINNVNG
jgi:hypothetical protein